MNTLYCQCGCGRITSLATSDRPKYGQVKGLPVRYIKGHNGRKEPETIDSLFGKCYADPVCGCWIWLEGLTTSNYGSLRRNRRLILAHRLAYELQYGAIPAGMNVCHKCDTPQCCNPSHLFLGTHKDNTNDMVSKGRAKFWGGPRFSDKELAEIRASTQSAAHLSEMYGVTARHIRKIKQGVRCCR